jgi:2-dehydro-3-deoxygluconokinase
MSSGFQVTHHRSSYESLLDPMATAREERDITEDYGSAPADNGFEVICLGETMVMVTPVEPVPLVQGHLFRLEIGGAESTVALYLAELNHQVAWAGRVGADPFGERILLQLADGGVDTRLVRIDDDGWTGVYFKDPGRDGSRVYYYRAGSAASRMSPADLDALPLDTSTLLHFSGITPGLSESCAELALELVRRAQSSRTLLSFDVNYRSGLWPALKAAPILLDLSRRADIVFVGLDEASVLWGTRSPRDVHALIGTDKLVVVKNSAVGATEFDGQTATFVAAPKLDVVEHIGAGDAFAAGFLSAFLRGESPSRRLELGHDLAARSLRSTSDYVSAKELFGVRSSIRSATVGPEPRA